MLTSIATQGKAPYKTVITHGMIVDEERQKMSKSLGNGIAPEDILKQYGADVMRLWVASSDYRQDMRISKDMLKHLSQNYLKIRNTARYILGNLADFDPKTDAVAYTDLTDLDKWALMKLNELTARVTTATSSTPFSTQFTTSASLICRISISTLSRTVCTATRRQVQAAVLLRPRSIVS